jgi:hypothetical protein
MNQTAHICHRQAFLIGLYIYICVVKDKKFLVLVGTLSILNVVRPLAAEITVTKFCSSDINLAVVLKNKTDEEQFWYRHVLGRHNILV